MLAAPGTRRRRWYRGCRSSSSSRSGSGSPPAHAPLRSRPSSSPSPPRYAPPQPANRQRFGREPAKDSAKESVKQSRPESLNRLSFTDVSSQTCLLVFQERRQRLSSSRDACLSWPGCAVRGRSRRDRGGGRCDRRLRALRAALRHLRQPSLCVLSKPNFDAL